MSTSSRSLLSKDLDPIQLYELNTIAYGLTSSSFLASRALQQTTHDFKSIFPQSADIVLSNFYADDLITGAESVDEALNM